MSRPRDFKFNTQQREYLTKGFKLYLKYMTNIFYLSSAFNYRVFTNLNH